MPRLAEALRGSNQVIPRRFVVDILPACIDEMLNDLGVSVDCLTPSTMKLARSLDDTVENFDSEVKPLLQGADLGYLLKAA